MARKQQFERRLRRAVENDPKLGAAAAKVWDDIATGYRAWAPNEKPYQVLEPPAAQGSSLFRIARALIRNQPLGSDASVAIDEAVEIAMVAQYFEDLKVVGDKDAPV